MQKSCQRRGNADMARGQCRACAQPGQDIACRRQPYLELTTSASRHWCFQAAAVYFRIWWLAANCLTDNFPTNCHSLQEETGWEC